MDVPKLLGDARRRSGLTVRQLARRAGTSHSAVAAYESGAKAPNSATLTRLVSACGFELSPHLDALSPFEDRVQRGRQLVEVLDLADQFPARHPAPSSKRFPTS